MTRDRGRRHRVTLLYTIDRPAAGVLGSGLLVHRIDLNAENALAGLPASEPVGEGDRTP